MQSLSQFLYPRLPSGRRGVLVGGRRRREFRRGGVAPLSIAPLLAGLPSDARRGRDQHPRRRRRLRLRVGGGARGGVRLRGAAGLQLEQLEDDDERLEEEVVPGDAAVAVDDGLERKVPPEGVELLVDAALGVRRREQLRQEDALSQSQKINK